MFPLTLSPATREGAHPTTEAGVCLDHHAPAHITGVCGDYERDSGEPLHEPGQERDTRWLAHGLGDFCHHWNVLDQEHDLLARLTIKLLFPVPCTRRKRVSDPLVHRAR
eukprot:2758774-Rhodomonas_salina.1